MNASHKSGQSLFPVILYQDVTTAIEWLERTFGFETIMSVPNEDGSIAHAEIRFAGEVVMLGTLKGTPGDPPWRGIYICVDDIDTHYARTIEAGAKIERALFETDYGSRDYSAFDLEGYIWHFGTYRP